MILRSTNLLDLHITWHNPTELDSKSSGKVDVDHQVFADPKDPHIGGIMLTAKISPGEDGNGNTVGCEVTTTIAAMFEFPKESSKAEIEKSMNADAIRVVYNILRGQLWNVIGAFPVHGYFLPDLDIDNMTAKKSGRQRSPSKSATTKSKSKKKVATTKSSKRPRKTKNK